MMFPKLLFFMSCFKIYTTLAGKNLAIVIIGQNDDYHSKLTSNLKNDIIFQSHNLSETVPAIFIYPQNFENQDAWTIYPLLPIIKKNLTEDIQWIIFVEDRTNIRLKLLISTLQNYNHREEGWLGHALTDSEATIIHHFAFYKDPSSFKYPNLGSGFAVTVPLLKGLCDKLSNQTYVPPNFHIDASHEFALFVTDTNQRNILQHEETFCTKEKTDCAIFPQIFQPCDNPKVVPVFAVKTCQKFHNNRVQVVQHTWGQYSKKLLFFSDKEETSIPTIKLNVDNTEQGHCAKTLEILRFLDKRLEKVEWVVLVDDDTILSISRISKLLTCFNTTVPMMIGERYRFSSNGDGYDYLTGGAGIVINRKAVQIVCKHCHCPKPDSPDDMILGACAKMFGIMLVHFPYFHQARPSDYAEGYLDTMDAVSFHKHWMLDPLLVYDEHFRDEDELFFKSSNLDVDQSQTKDEL